MIFKRRKYIKVMLPKEKSLGISNPRRDFTTEVDALHFVEQN